MTSIDDQITQHVWIYNHAMEAFKKYQNEAMEELENGNKKEYYVCRDLAKIFQKDARDSIMRINELKERK